MAGINATLYPKKEPLLTKKEAMEYLNIKNPRTFMKLINEQQLPYVKIGKKYCVLLSDLNQWIQKNRMIKV